MSCDAQSLLSAAAASGYFRLSQRDLLEAIATAYATGTGSNVYDQFVLAVATDQYRKLSERDLFQAWLVTSCSSGCDAQTLYTAAVAQGMPRLSERNLWEVILQAISGAPAQDWANANPPAHRLSERDLLMVIVAAGGGGLAQDVETTAQARGYGRLSYRMILECLAAQLCSNPPSGGNIVPPGATCQAGSYTLAVKGNTTYQIQWGNETSVNICGTVYTSPGVGLFTIVTTPVGCLTMVFACGAGAITTRVSPTTKTTTVTGLLWQIAPAGTTVVASWDVPPGFVTSTEVWTSPDNVTFTKAATVAAPGTSAAIAAPAVGSALYMQARWNNGGPFTTVPEPAWGQIADWARRIVVNGSIETQAIINAHNTMWGSFVAAGIDSLQIAFLTFSPTGLVNAITPVKVGGGNDPWTNANFVPADLDVNGLLGDPTGNSLNPGFNLSTLFPDDTKLGYSVYSPQTASFITNGVIGVSDAAFTNNGSLLVCQGGTSYFECWNVTGAAGSGFLSVNETFSGYYSGNRTAANAMALYHANSVTPFAAVATGAGTQGSRPNASIGAFAVNVIGVGLQCCNLRLSFLSLHQPYTSVQSQAEFNAIQALRVAIGGGFV